MLKCIETGWNESIQVKKTVEIVCVIVCVGMAETQFASDLDTLKKSRIQETKHLSTDADSSTDTTVGWTKNTKKPKTILKRKK